MSLSERKVYINGIEHTMLLDADDAKRYDETAKAEAERASEGTEPSKLGAAQNKARTTPSK